MLLWVQRRYEAKFGTVTLSNNSDYLKRKLAGQCGAYKLGYLPCCLVHNKLIFFLLSMLFFSQHPDLQFSSDKIMCLIDGARGLVCA